MALRAPPGICRTIFSSDVHALVRCRVDELLPAERSASLLGEEPLEVELAVVADGAVVCSARSTQSTFDPLPDAGEFPQQHFVFSLKLRDLPRESSLVVYVRTQGSVRELYRGVLPLFNRRAVLRQGRQLLALVRIPEEQDGELRGGYPLFDWRRHSNEVVLEQAPRELQEAVRLTQASDFLERGCLPRATPGLEEADDYFKTKAHDAIFSAGLPWLSVHLPTFPHPVVFAEPQYDSPFEFVFGGPLSTPLKEDASEAALSALACADWLLQPLQATEEALIAGRTFKTFAEFDADTEHPAALKSRRLTGASRSRLKDRDARPNADERRLLNELVLRAKRQLTADERDLLFRFRWSLTENPGALTKFLHAVDWSDLEERQHALELMGQWSPVDVDDAMELLSTDFKGVAEVRRHAVERLEQAKDDDIHMYLLQLVQALRYEPSSSATAPTPAAAAASPAESPAPPPSSNPLTRNRSNTDFVADVGPLASFLIQRSSRSCRLASALHWYLAAETDDRERGAYFERVRLRLLDVLDETAEGKDIKRYVELQRALRRKLLWCLRTAKAAKRERIQAKVELFRKALREEPPDTLLPLDLVAGLDEPIPLPVDPRISLWKVNPENSSLLKSAMNPAVLACEVAPFGKGKSAKFIKKVMVKEGDDLRQDQLVLQLVILMDSILKRYGLDLQLTPYQVVALSANDGFVEFVQDATNLSTILKDYNNDIHNFLRTHHPHNPRGDTKGDWGPHNSYGIKPEVLENFIRSSAGYCVITYILGIGDRHLDNLMVTRDGRLFHIDFGFILGKDPKPFPSPMRICREMVDGFGGASSPGYQSFKSKCCQAYKILRRHAKLIINLLYLMIDSGIKDMSGDPQFAILKVEQKFSAQMDDEQSEEHFLTLIDESVNAWAPALFELAHKVNVARQ